MKPQLPRELFREFPNMLALFDRMEAVLTEVESAASEPKLKQIITNRKSRLEKRWNELLNELADEMGRILAGPRGPEFYGFALGLRDILSKPAYARILQACPKLTHMKLQKNEGEGR